MAPPHTYSAVSSDEDPEDCGPVLPAEKPLFRRRPSEKWKIFGPVAWLFTTFLLISFLIVSIAAYTREPDEKECAAKLSIWSPAYEAVEIVDVQFQNRFMEKSIYRGKPNKERENAWLELWNFGPINIPEEKLDVLNKSREIDWKHTKPEKGGGIVGSLEVFHHLHCLDLVRRYTYRDEYDYSKSPAFDGTPQEIREHVDHCINSLRLFLQCKVDLTPYLIMTDKRRPLGINTDFNTRHKCVNFDKIHAWAKKHELDTNDYQNLD